MAIPTDYVSGTITLTNGSSSFSGSGTGWLAADFREGDLIIWIDGGEDFSSPIIQQILTNTSGTLISEWVGPTLTNAAYRMRYQWDSSRVSAQSRQLVEQLGNGNITSFSGLEGPGVPVFNGPHSLVIKPEQDFINGIAYNVQVDELSDRDAYDGQIEGFSVLVSDNGDGRAALYSKVSNASGDWTAPAYITGPIGAQSIIEATVSSLPTGSEPEVNVTPITGGYNLAFELPEAEGFYWASEYSASETYPLSSVVRYNRSSFIAIQNVPINESPSNAFPPVDNSFWEVLAQGGANGTGTIVEIENGNGILIDDSDPTSPIISLDAALGDLKDVDLTTNPPEDGQSVVWNETEEKWVPGSGSGVVKGHLFGLGTSNNTTDETNDIDIAAGEASSDSANPILMTFPAMTKRLDANWAPGSGNGFRNSSAAITNRTYFLFGVSKNNGADPDFYATTTPVAATALTHLQAETGGAAYTHARYIGAIIRDSDAIRPYVQKGPRFELVTRVSNLATTSPGTTRTLRTMTVPIGIEVLALFQAAQQTNAAAGTGCATIFTSPDGADITPNNGNADIITSKQAANLNSAGEFSRRTNSAGQICSRGSASDAQTALYLNTLGWIDLNLPDGGAGNSDDYWEIEGVLKVSAAGVWSILDDATHQSLNVASVTQNATSITINFAVTGSKVRSSYVTPDSALALARVFTGASVGLSNIVISLANPTTSPLNPSSITDTGANIWFNVRLWK